MMKTSCALDLRAGSFRFVPFHLPTSHIFSAPWQDKKYFSFFYLLSLTTGSNFQNWDHLKYSPIFYDRTRWSVTSSVLRKVSLVDYKDYNPRFHTKNSTMLYELL